MMTGTKVDLAAARLGVAAAHEQGRRRDDVREHPEGRHAEVERRGPGVREAGAAQHEGVASGGCRSEVGKLDGPVKPEDNRGGGSDDIGDVSWTVPTITLRYPANIPGMPGHHWASAIAEATPVAHKGVDGRREGARR